MMPVMRSFTAPGFQHRSSFRKFAAGLLVALSVLVSSPHTASATSDEDADHYDARIQGYDPKVESMSWGSSGCWVMMVLFGAVAIGVLFKDGKRSHLD